MSSPRAGRLANAAAGVATYGGRALPLGSAAMITGRRMRTARQERANGVSWSVVFVAFLFYTLVITTYALPGGDISIGLALVALPFQRERLRFPTLLVVFLLLLAWCVVGWSRTMFPGTVGDELLSFAKVGLVLLVAANALNSRGRLRVFILFWLACYALYPVRGTLVNYFLHGYTVWGRALWNFIYANANDLAVLTLLQLALCAGVLVTEQRKWIRYLALAGIPVLTLVIVLTQSRGGILGLVTFGVFAVLGHRRRLRAIGFAAVLGIAIAMAAPSGVWDRLAGMTKLTDTTQLVKADREGSAIERFWIWQTALEIIGDHQVYGVGWGAYMRAHAMYAPWSNEHVRRLGGKDTHSTYLNVMAEAGIPGFCLFMVLIAMPLIAAERTRRRSAQAFPRASQQLYLMEAGTAGYLVTAVFGSFAHVAFFYLYLMLLVATAKVLEAEMREALPLESSIRATRARE